MEKIETKTSSTWFCTHTVFPPSVTETVTQLHATIIMQHQTVHATIHNKRSVVIGKYRNVLCVGGHLNLVSTL